MVSCCLELSPTAYFVTFESLEELKAKIEQYKKDNLVELWRRDTRTMAAARKRGVNCPIIASLKYYEVEYCCIHGGQAFQPIEVKGNDALYV